MKTRTPRTHKVRSWMLTLAASCTLAQAAAPSGTDKTIPILPGASYTISLADWGFSDAADASPDSFGYVKISSLPSGGTLKVNTTSISSTPQTVQVASVPVGTNWTSWTPPSLIQTFVNLAASNDGTRVAASSFENQTYVSTDCGYSWTATNIGLWTALDMSGDGMRIAGAGEAVYYPSGPLVTNTVVTSWDGGVTWPTIPNLPVPGNVVTPTLRDIASSDDGLTLAAADAGIKDQQTGTFAGGYIYVFRNVSGTWSWTQTPAPKSVWHTIACSKGGNHLVAASDSGLFYTSSDGGTSWTQRTRPGSFSKESITITELTGGTGPLIVAAASNGHLHTSTDGGASWTSHFTDANRFWNSVTCSDDGSMIAASVHNDRVYVSTDSGLTWTPGPPNPAVVGLACSDDGRRLFASGRGLPSVNPRLYTSIGTDPGPPDVVEFVAPVTPGSYSFTFQVQDLGQTAFEDTTPNTLTFVVAGPEMHVEQNSAAVSIGDTVDFGAVALVAAQNKLTFDINNTGTGNLNLHGTLSVQITGPDAAHFSVTSFPGTQVLPSASTQMELSFDPSSIGPKTATITIPSDDPAANPFTFTVTGNGQLTTKLPQTISFTLPSTLYLAQNQLYFTGYATSGLPVVYTIQSGPAFVSVASVNLSELNPTGPGTVVVKATQPGNSVYAPAAPVTRTILIKVDPTVLTLIDLNQVYDTDPRVISTLGGAGPVTITYKLSSSSPYGPTPPVNAGSYPVKATDGTTTKSGTLVVAKAPLFVTPDDKNKFAGQLNPPLTFTYGPFQGLETASSAVSTSPAITTTAVTSSPGGVYPIKATGGSVFNYAFVYQQGTLVVDTFAGEYEAMISDTSGALSNKFILKVLPNGASFTGKLLTASESTAFNLTGSLTLNPPHATATCLIQKGATLYRVSFDIDHSGPVLIDLAANNVPVALGMVGSKLMTGTAPWLGQYTFVIQASPDPTQPPGAGWATANIAANGLMTLNGRLGDGTAFTTTARADSSNDPIYRVFAQPYMNGSAIRTGSYVGGQLTLLPHPTLPAKRIVSYQSPQGVHWAKAPKATDTSYRAGIASNGPLLVSLDPWVKPVPASQLPVKLGLSPNQFNIQHTATGSASDGNIPTVASTNGTTVSIITPTGNPATWTMTLLNLTDGRFAGTFKLKDGTINRTVPFTGIMRQPNAGELTVGDGLFILPPLPSQGTTERTTGEILWER